MGEGEVFFSLGAQCGEFPERTIAGNDVRGDAVQLREFESVRSKRVEKAQAYFVEFTAIRGMTRPAA